MGNSLFEILNANGYIKWKAQSRVDMKILLTELFQYNIITEGDTGIKRFHQVAIWS